MSQRDIADKLSVQEKTVGKWKTNGLWEEERNALELTVNKELPRILKQFKELNDNIEAREEGLRFATKEEVGILKEYRILLRSLDEMPLSIVVNVIISLLNFVKSADLNKAKELSEWSDAFIKHIASQKL